LERRLAAILSADVVGYTRLMGADEAGTLERITELRQQVLEPLIGDHHGRIVKLMGDGLLAEFGSVVDAVSCAVAWQSEVAEREAAGEESKRLKFRIGVNLGDIIVQGEDIYGDGVNIAARLEKLAEPGGVSISGPVFDLVKGKFGTYFEDRGEQQVKNVPGPIRIYSAGVDAVRDVSASFEQVVAQVGKAPVEDAIAIDLSLPDTPSIAVLPFTNMSTEAEQEFFSDGITEDIITALSKLSDLVVVARDSTFTYKDQTIDMRKVSREQGVRYVLQGSVRKAGNRVRITAQLTDATTGHHLWAERYDRNLKDVFAIQDEIMREIVVALDVHLRGGEQARFWSSGTTNLQAWECMRRGADCVVRMTKEDQLEAKRLFEKALVVDPHYAVAWVMLGWVYYIEADVAFGIRSATNSEPAQVLALECAEKALALDASCSDAYAQIALCHLAANEFDQATEMSEKAIALAPNNAENLATAALIMNKSGKPERGLELIKKAMRLCPIYRTGYLDRLGMAYRLTGRPDAAITAYSESIKRQPEFLGPHVNLASILGELGRREEAEKEAREIIRLEPNFSIGGYMAGLSYRNPSDLARIEEGLRKAGLPD